MAFWNSRNRQVAISADDPSMDLMLLSTDQVCFLCKIELLRYTRLIVLVNPQEQSSFYQQRYRSYCVRCIALSAFEISGPSLMLTYYVCPSLNKSETDLLGWTPNQVSRLFDRISRRCATKGRQLYRDFAKGLQTNKQQKQMESFYEKVYSSYFKGTDMDHRNKKKQKEIGEEKDKMPKRRREIQEIQINTKGKKKHYQQFVDLLHSNQEIVLPLNVQHDYFLIFLASKEVQQTFRGSNFSRKPCKRQSELLSTIVKKYAESQIRKQQLRANVNQLYESYHHASQGLHIRQNLEVNVTKQALLKYNHQEIEQLSKLPNFQGTFKRLADHREQAINLSKLFKVDGSAKKIKSTPKKSNESSREKLVAPKKKNSKVPRMVTSSEKEDDYNPKEQKKKVARQKRMKRELRRLEGESSSKKSSVGSRIDSSRERKPRKKY